MRDPLIEFRNVAKSFGENHVLNNVNLKIYENEITTIIGKSGTGKSVLLKHIIGLMSPDEGSIFFKGRPINGMKSREWDECRMQISYMFQNNALFDSMTVFENIALALRQTTAFKNQEIEIKVMSRIEQMDLSNVVNEYPSALSGGMQKRVALARALITDPAIVLFDEPTTGQDPVRKNIILSMIARYRKQFGFTAVLISHDLPDIFFVSDRILILWEGKMDFQGSYEELTKLGHPMLHELKESVDNLSEELDWGVSREMLKQRYDLKSDRIKEGL